MAGSKANIIGGVRYMDMEGKLLTVTMIVLMVVWGIYIIIS